MSRVVSVYVFGVGVYAFDVGVCMCLAFDFSIKLFNFQIFCLSCYFT